MLRLFDSVCDRLAEGSDAAKYKKILRPIMLELVLRLARKPQRAADSAAPLTIEEFQQPVEFLRQQCISRTVGGGVARFASPVHRDRDRLAPIGTEAPE